MYLYFLPLVDNTKTTTDAGAAAGVDSNSSNNNNNNGASADQTEVTEAEWASAETWVNRARNNDIILFPPQLYILSLLAPLLKGSAGLPAGTSVSPAEHYAAERRNVAALIHDGPAPGEDKATFVPWADRVISPRIIGKLPDDARGRSVMALDYPGPELKSSGRGGDAYRLVVLGNMPPGPPRDLELVLRADVMPQVVAKPKIQATGKL